MSEATDLSQAVVDQAHREEIEKARITITNLAEALASLAATLDVVTAERDRARDLAVRAGAFDQDVPPEAPRSPLTPKHTAEGPTT